MVQVADKQPPGVEPSEGQLCDRPSFRATLAAGRLRQSARQQDRVEAVYCKHGSLKIKATSIAMRVQGRRDAALGGHDRQDEPFGARGGQPVQQLDSVFA